MDKIPRESPWELLLVDNGSTDHTQETIESFRSELPIRYIFEPEAGLSNARNRGVDEAHGDFICWTDDDVRISAPWLKSYAEAFAAQPGYAFFGGPVEPDIEGSPPPWFLENRKGLGSLLAERELGSEAFELRLEDGTLPYGANFAVRSVEQRRYRYDPALGVAPHQRRLGEETEVLQAIARDGGKGLWVPDARVFHLIPAARQTLAYVDTYERSSGETWAYLSKGQPSSQNGATLVGKRSWIGVPLWIWRSFIQARCSYYRHRLAGRSRDWLPHWQHQAFWRGAINYLRTNASRT